MLNLETYSQILYHIKTNLGLLKSISNGNWYQSFCPYCNDRTRKNNPNHGHLYISKMFSHYRCFRCDTFGKLSQLLKYTEFTDITILRNIEKQEKTSSLVYGISSKKIYQTNFNVKEKLLSIYENFKKDNPSYFNKFTNYIYKRCLDIDPIEFLLFPVIEKNMLTCGIMNNSGHIITYRTILSDNIRYIKPSSNFYYYFQNINKIDNYNNIVICEGAFDLINLCNYSMFNDSFYIAMNGKFFNKIIHMLLSNYLLIGKYHLHIIYDRDKFDNTKKISNMLKVIINQVNPEIMVTFYKPIFSKDVSELMFLNKF